MRKNFLLLFLLTLLPLAGWAADISLGKIVVPSPFYGESPDVAGISVYNEANALLTKDADYTFDGFFSDASCTQSLTAVQVATKVVGTTMYVHVTGINGYEGELIGSFEVKPMELTVTVTGASKTYGDNDPASFVISSVEDAHGYAVAAAVQNDVQVSRVPGENVKYVGGVVSPYAYTASMKTNTNYIVKTVNGGFTINPKAFTDGTTVDITVTANLTYNGAEQKATVQVKDKAKNTILVENTDYTIAWTNNVLAHATNPTATITGKGNYAATAIAKNFAIKTAPLLVTPTAEKEYDGTAAVNAIPANYAAFTEKVKFTYQGFVDDKTAEDITWTGTTSWASGDATANVGTYTLDINDGNDLTLANYHFLPVQGEFKITKKTVTVTATDDLLHEYGEAENFAWTLGAGTFVAADEDALNNAVKIVKADAPNANGEYALTPAFKTDAEIDATAGLSAADKTAAKQAVKNYNMTAVAGKLTYDAAPLQIALKESAYTLTKTYDGQPVSVTLNKESGLVIIGLKGSDAVNTDNLTLEVVDNSAKAGTYQLKLSGAVAPNYNITYIPSQYKINQKNLTVTAHKQIFVVGEVLNLNTALYTIDKTNGLVEGDNASDVFKLTTTVTKDGDNKVNCAAGDYAVNIVDAGTATSKWANYNVTAIPGLAKVYGASVVLDDTKNLLSSPLNAAHDNALVTFNSRTLNSEQWNVLVLPFDVTVKQLSSAFGYAVVDVLDETATDGNVHFKLKVSGTIAANTPFIIYPSDENNNLNQIVFEDVNVKKVTTATVSKADQGGNKFFGTYQTTGIYGEPFRYMSKGTWYNAAKYTESSKCNIKPLRGYLDLSGSTAAAPVIYIEEPNGDVTAIETVKTERVAIENDGWYTLNGVKLQNAPTQKGIYVRNGKKVVIK